MIVTVTPFGPTVGAKLVTTGGSEAVAAGAGASTSTARVAAMEIRASDEPRAELRRRHCAHALTEPLFTA